MHTPPISLKPATKEDEPLLSKLLSDYQRELLTYSDQGEEELKPYRYLPHYFTDADRAAFFIIADGDVAGFVLINTHTLIEKSAHSIAEFYITPAYRRKGIGEQAATLAFARFPGKWEVAQMAPNQPAIHFWRKVIHRATNGRYQETILNTDQWHGPVQTFDNSAAAN